MKKATSILLLVGGIVSICLCVLFLSLMALFFVLGSPGMTDIIRQGLQDGTIKTSFQGDPETILALVQFTFVICGVVFAVLAAFSIPSSILCFLARNRQSTGYYVACIILGVISGATVGAVGGIFGLITENRSTPPSNDVIEQ